MVGYYYKRIKDELVFRKGSLIHNKLYTPSQIESYNPFFIISPGRSGSTFLRKQIMATGQVNIPPESYQCIPESIKYYIRYHSKKWDLLVHDIFDIFIGDPGFRYWKIDLARYEKDLSRVDENERTLFTIIDYIYRLHTQIHMPGAQYYGDKTPLLSMNVKWLDLLFTRSKYIFLYRDPVDIVYSRIHHFSERLEHAINRVLWSLREMHRFVESGKNRDILILKYEEMTRDPDAAIEKVFVFLDIIPGNRTAKNIHLGDDILKHHVHLDQPVSMKFIGKGYHYFSEQEVRMIKEKTDKFMVN